MHMKRLLMASSMFVASPILAQGTMSMGLAPFIVEDVMGDRNLVVSPGTLINPKTNRPVKSPVRAREGWRLWGVDPDISYLKDMIVGREIGCQTYPTMIDEEPIDPKLVQCFISQDLQVTDPNATRVDIAGDSDFDRPWRRVV
jgi:hypothetical protein